VVFDIGAHLGETAQYYAERCDPHLYLFEPQAGVIPVLEELFGANPKVKIFPFGLSDKTGWFPMCKIGTDGCHFHGCTSDDYGELVDIWEFVRKHKIKQIDLCHMNCEGAEFEILPRMLDTGLIKQCRFLAIQWHPGNKDMRYKHIRDRIELTHKVRYDFPLAWVTFERRN